MLHAGRCEGMSWCFLKWKPSFVVKRWKKSVFLIWLPRFVVFVGSCCFWSGWCFRARQRKWFTVCCCLHVNHGVSSLKRAPQTSLHLSSEKVKGEQDSLMMSELFLDRGLKKPGYFLPPFPEVYYSKPFTRVSPSPSLFNPSLWTEPQVLISQSCSMKTQSD